MGGLCVDRIGVDGLMVDWNMVDGHGVDRHSVDMRCDRDTDNGAISVSIKLRINEITHA